jgi:predicted transcriptional regulator
MSDANVPIRVNRIKRDRLESISNDSGGPTADLAAETIRRFVESEEAMIASLHEARAQLRAGNGIAHEDVMKRGLAVINAATSARKG